MVRWRVVRLIVGRELRERVRTRVFLGTTALMLLAALAAGFVPALLDDDPGAIRVGVVRPVSPELSAAVRFASAPSGRAIDVVELESRDGGDAVLRAGRLDLVVDGSAIRVHGEETGDAARDLAARLAGIIPLRLGLGAAGVPGADADRLLVAPPLPVAELEPPREDEGSRDVVTLGNFVLYMALVGYGSWVATGVLEEKASRVVEVVLAAVRPAELLAGKVLGIGLLGLAQLVLVGAVGLGAAAVSGVDLPASAPAAVGLVLLWFVLGFAFYSCAFAALGATASRYDDAQSALSPLMVVLVAGFLLASAVQADPDGAWARASSFIPPLAPLTVPARVLLGRPPLWEPVVAVLLTLAGSVVLVQLGARAYGGAVLRFGARLGLRELWRASAAGGHGTAVADPRRHGGPAR